MRDIAIAFASFDNMMFGLGERTALIVWFDDRRQLTRQ